MRPVTNSDEPKAKSYSREGAHLPVHWFFGNHLNGSPATADTSKLFRCMGLERLWYYLGWSSCCCSFGYKKIVGLEKLYCLEKLIAD